MPEGAVYVGRPTKWGNPFAGTNAAKKYAMLLTLGGTCKTLKVLRSLGELTGKDLVCWCPLDKPCHADVLLELANDPEVLKLVKGSTDK